ncbi:hypothetical protein [Mycolicibacterium smegmatis]|uniref:Uncharacterized protein n=1 Tax=Mycolicibacterium smegmatis (strain MKD8) TaxID=1214915 RepID=A0A2U9PWU3_MYCSE|nr:hypothetical protein [Mycolicibacterium smegmatis]AWT56217.1 hypothetical protein D806_052670 [Mycolicibacterium smegmatis MKD8]
MTEKPGEDTGETEDDEPTVRTTWTSPFGVERDRRMAELQAMPGFRLKIDLEALGRAGHIMYRNAEELSKHATDYLSGHRFAQDVDDEFEKELVRYLHNYLTSVTSLIDSQRVVMRHCWGKDSDFEKGAYTEQRKASFETGEAEFMKDLRNYCTHRAVPVPGVSTTFSGGRGRPSVIANRLTFDRDALLESDSWSAPAKAYLQAKEKQFDVGPVIASYVNTASRFFNWFVNEINERNAEAKAEFIAAGEAYREWYEDQMGMNTPGYKALFPDPSPQNRAERRGQRRQPKRTSKSKRNGKRK